jgi:hypothetical protein
VTLEELRRDKKDGILRAAQKYGTRNIRVFGAGRRSEIFDFFTSNRADRKERRAFESASIASWARE